jgi:hypothetical protein
MADVTTAPPATRSDGQPSDSQAKEKAQEVAGQAKEKAQEAAGEAKGRVREQVDQRSTQAGEQVSTTASDLRSVGDELRNQGKETPAKLAEQAAERTERLGSYLTDSDADRILSDVEDFARKQPWAVVAGGLALGFAASRFLKASSSERYRSRDGGSAGYGTPAPTPAPATDGRALSAPPAGAVPPPPPPIPPTGVAGGSPHTTPQQGHPAGPGPRSDREVGGPTPPPGAAGGNATGGAPGTHPSGFEPHR